MKDKKEKKEKTKFNLAFDNLAIPEVHIGGNAHGQGNVEHKHPDADGEMEEEVVTFADVAIPEIHITRYGSPELQHPQMLQFRRSISCDIKSFLI